MRFVCFLGALVLAGNVVFGAFVVDQQLLETEQGLTYTSLALGDIDDDGDLDLIATGRDGFGNYRLLIYENDGEGIFLLDQEPMGAGQGLLWGGVALGDLDNDHDLDLAVGGSDNVSPSPDTTRFITYTNDGAGFFNLYEEPIGIQQRQGYLRFEIDIGDVDADGDLDVVVMGYDEDYYTHLDIYRNDGSGSLVFSDWVMTMQGAVRFGDIDGDGDLDLVTSGWGGFDGRLITWINDGAGHFSFGEEPMGHYFGIGAAGDLALGDFDDDGDLDLVAGGADNISYASRLIVFKNDGGGSFSLHQEPMGANQGLSFPAIALGDVDNDDDLDLTVGGDGTLAIYANDGTGSFSLVEQPLGPNAGINTYPGLVMGDIDADGDLDFVASGGRLTVFKNDMLNTPAGDPVVTFDTLDSKVAVTLEFENVSVPGDTTISAVSVSTPGGYFLVVSDAFELSTTAVFDSVVVTFQWEDGSSIDTFWETHPGFGFYKNDETGTPVDIVDYSIVPNPDLVNNVFVSVPLTNLSPFYLVAEDTTPPVITCPPSVQLECGGSTDPASTGVATATDDSGAASVDFSDDDLSSCGYAATIVRTWTATDGAGNEALCTQEVIVVDTMSPTLAVPSSITAECSGPGGVPSSGPQTQDWLNSAIASDICGETTLVHNAPDFFPVGATVVTYVAEDECGNQTDGWSTVTIVDTTPPVITVEVTPSTLWPPNHRMIDTTASVAASDVCSASSIVLTSVTSNEADNGVGDGNTINDIQDAEPGTPDFDFKLRAERAGGGNGRIYTAVYTATDGSANSNSSAGHAVVPHDQGGAIDPLALSVEQSGDGTVIYWTAVPGAQTYDVIRGLVSGIEETEVVISLGTVACIEEDSPDESTWGWGDLQVPDPGEVFFYLVEYFDGTSSSYGTESADKPRAPGPGGCY